MAVCVLTSEIRYFFPYTVANVLTLFKLFCSFVFSYCCFVTMSILLLTSRPFG